LLDAVAAALIRHFVHRLRPVRRGFVHARELPALRGMLNRPSQQEPDRSTMQHQGPISGIAAFGHWVATAGYDNQIILWDARRREALARCHHDHLVNHCAFSADGRWLVSASSDYSARVWSLPDLRLQVVLAGHGDDVDMAVFSPDAGLIATCALDRLVRVFDRQGRCLHAMPGHTGNVLSLAWSADGRQLLSSSVDGSIRRWDAVLGLPLDTTDLQVRSDSVEIDTDGTAYAGDDRGRIAIINGAAVAFVQAHRAGVKRLAFDVAQRLLVSLSYDRSIALWRVGGAQRLTQIGRTELPGAAWARAAALLPDGKVAVGTFGATYAVFDPAAGGWDMNGVRAGPAINAVLVVNTRVYSVGDAGQVRKDGAPIAETGSLCNFLVASGTRVFTGGQLGRLFDAQSGQVLYQHHSPLNCGTAFEREGRPHIAIGSYTGDILFFELHASGARLVRELHVYENAVKGLFSSNGLLFSVCASTDIAWHRSEDGALVRRVNKAHERIANDCCALGEGRFATVSRDRHLRLWHADAASAPEAYLSEHPNSVKCLAVNDEHTAVLTGSYGGTVALFDLVRKCWAPLQRPTAAGISAITWDRARQRFLAASYDGSIYPVPT
jgi:toxoflavin biosynthesis protein ToxC